MNYRLPNNQLRQTLLPAYSCPYFGTCKEAKFVPSQGHMPRGFVGAYGDLQEIEVIFVIAEPGHPLKQENYENELEAEKLLDFATATAYDLLLNQKTTFHKNMRWVLNHYWPNLELSAQLSRVWITESRLCSIENKIGPMKDKLCSTLYLSKQLEILKDIPVIAFGNKARDRILQIDGFDATRLFCARALAPPGSTSPKSKKSWIESLEFVKGIKINS